MYLFRVIAVAALLVTAVAGAARAEWFGMVTLPNHVQLLAEVADTQQIVTGKPFVANVTRLDGKIETATYVPVEVSVIGDAISVVAQDKTGNKLTLSLIRRPDQAAGNSRASASR